MRPMFGNPANLSFTLPKRLTAIRPKSSDIVAEGLQTSLALHAGVAVVLEGAGQDEDGHTRAFTKGGGRRQGDRRARFKAFGAAQVGATRVAAGKGAAGGQIKGAGGSRPLVAPCGGGWDPTKT